jgi:predicted RNA-binding Zn ribbon-like protein
VTVDAVPDLYPSEPLPVRLMNTVWANRDGVQDSLTTVAQLQQWARQCGVRPSTGLSRADLALARSVRDALRRLAADVLDDTREGAVSGPLTAAEALDRLNEVLAACVPEVRSDGHRRLRRGWRWHVAGFERELGVIALEAADLLAQGREGLGACHGPGCVLYFERVPVRREWCSTGCGNRARVARHYRRRKDATEPRGRATAPRDGGRRRTTG